MSIAAIRRVDDGTPGPCRWATRHKRSNRLKHQVARRFATEPSQPPRGAADNAYRQGVCSPTFGRVSSTSPGGEAPQDTQQPNVGRHLGKELLHVNSRWKRHRRCAVLRCAGPVHRGRPDAQGTRVAGHLPAGEGARASCVGLHHLHRRPRHDEPPESHPGASRFQGGGAAFNSGGGQARGLAGRRRHVTLRLSQQFAP